MGGMLIGEGIFCHQSSTNPSRQGLGFHRWAQDSSQFCISRHIDDGISLETILKSRRVANSTIGLGQAVFPRTT